MMAYARAVRLDPLIDPVERARVAARHRRFWHACYGIIDAVRHHGGAGDRLLRRALRAAGELNRGPRDIYLAIAEEMPHRGRRKDRLKVALDLRRLDRTRRAREQRAGYRTEHPKNAFAAPPRDATPLGGTWDGSMQ